MSRVVACSTSGFRTPLAEALARIAGLGFNHVDLLAIGGWDHVDAPRLAADFEAEAGRVERLLRSHRLQAVALNFAPAMPLPQRADPAANTARVRAADAVARLARRLGTARVSVYPGYWRADLGPWEEAFADAVASWRELLAAGAAHGVEFLVEPHVNTVCATPDQARALLEALPGLRVAYDPSHFAHDGVPAVGTAFLLSRTGHVHLRDAAPGRLHAPCGQGVIDFAALGRALAGAGYDGPVSLEPLPGFAGDLDAELRALRDHALAWG